MTLPNLRDDGEAAAIVAEHEKGGAVGTRLLVPELQAHRDVLEAEPAVLLVVHGRRGVEEVDGPETRIFISAFILTLSRHSEHEERQQ
jgi:hypothetical protein